MPTGIPPLRGSLQAALIAGDAINARTVTMQEYHYLLPERTVFYFQGAYLRMKLYIVPSPDNGIIAQLFSKIGFRVVTYLDGKPDQDIHTGIKALVQNHWEENSPLS